MRLLTLGLFVAMVLPAQVARQEVALTLGRVQGQTRSSGASPLDIDAGTAFQADYGFRALGKEKVALYAGVHFMAVPQQRVSSPLGSVTRDFASLFLTPQVTLKFAPASRLSPWGTVGGGYALFEQSTTRIDGAPNDAPRNVNTGALMFGGGLDFAVLRRVALRGEVRDFVSGGPAFNTIVSGRQHNVVIGGGFVVRF